jgi:hypothetical protein
MPRPPKGKQNHAVLARFALTRARQKAWREQPERMELIRRQATAKAEAVKEQRHQRFKDFLATLPDEMTSDELRSLVLVDYCRELGVTHRSFFLRVKRRGLLAYDPSKALWLNLSKLSPYAGLET